MSYGKPIKRPYSTHYFTLASDTEADVVSHGASMTSHAAASNALRRMMLGQYKKATVHDRETGKLVHELYPGNGGITLQYGSEGMDVKKWERETSRRKKAWEALLKLKLEA